MSEQNKLNVNGKKISLKNVLMGVDKHKKDSQPRANNLLSSSTFQEFSTQNNYRPESQFLSRNDYNTNTPSNPHNRSYQALDPYLNERIRHESSKIIIENNENSDENGNLT